MGTSTQQREDDASSTTEEQEQFTLDEDDMVALADGEFTTGKHGEMFVPSDSFDKATAQASFDRALKDVSDTGVISEDTRRQALAIYITRREQLENLDIQEPASVHDRMLSTQILNVEQSALFTDSE